MPDIVRLKDIRYGSFIWLLFLLAIVMPPTAGASTLDTRYPGLTTGLLKSAGCGAPRQRHLAGGRSFTISTFATAGRHKDQEPKLRSQLEKNLFFLLEQEAVRRVLLNEARKAGILVSDGGDENGAIQALFEHRTKELTVSEDEARAFYAANKEMVGGAPFEQVADGIRQYLLQDKKQQAVSAYIDSTGRNGPVAHQRKMGGVPEPSGHGQPG